MPNFKFLASTVAEIWKGSKNSPKWSRDPWWPMLTQILIFTIGHLAVNLHAKFRISSFNRCRDMEGVQKFPKMVTWPPGDPFLPNLSFFTIMYLVVDLHAKFRISSFSHCRYMEGSQNSQKWSRDPLATPFDENFHFFDDRAPCDYSACQISSF